MSDRRFFYSNFSDLAPNIIINCFQFQITRFNGKNYSGIKSRQKSAMWPASHLAESLTMETKQKIKNFRILLPVGQDLEVGVFVVISD